MMRIEDKGNEASQELGYSVIHLAGGCFWGLEKLMKSISGVKSVISGYANGKAGIIPTYEAVCTGLIGYRETVKVIYDPAMISLDAILFAFFNVIDPTQKNRQGHDIGSQYQTGIYYSDEISKLTVERIADIEKERYGKLYVELEKLTSFFEAEEYHQDYLGKNPSGYCHITPDKIVKTGRMLLDPGDYKRPAKEEISGKLTNLQYRVTQESATETPFKNEYWDQFKRGIYVDIITGEPLFTSAQKYHSSCGWPSFSAGLDDNSFSYIEDNSHNRRRTEVRSRTGNSHLGHIFHNDAESPNGVRYCINSAALRFVPYEEMDEQGYGDLKEYV